MYKSLSFYGKFLSFILLVIAMVLLRNYNIFLLICGMIFILSFLNKNRLYLPITNEWSNRTKPNVEDKVFLMNFIIYSPVSCI